MQKARARRARGGDVRDVAYTGRMDYIDFMWVKFLAVVGLAFLYGIWRGLTGRQ